MPSCPQCHNTGHFRKNGTQIQKTGKYQKYICLECYRVIVGEKISDPPFKVKKIGI